MKIAFICNEYPPAPHGGIGTFIKSLARQLATWGNEIFVIGYDPTVLKTRWATEDKVSVLRIVNPFKQWPAAPIGRYRFGPNIFVERWYLSCCIHRICSEKGFELVESYDWSGPLWFKPGNVPLVVRLHGANSVHAYYEGRHISRLYRYLERRNVAMADALVSVSHHIGKITLEALGLSARSFQVIYNGVDTKLFQPKNITSEANKVLYVGSLSRRKGIHELMRAWPLVLDKLPKARLILVGRIPEEHSEEYIRSLLAPVPQIIHDTIHFVGYVPHAELPGWYSRATVAVFPSHAEAFGLTCAEAMACGTPVIMTSKASGPELVEHGVSGLLVDPSNIQAIADTIVTMLCDKELRRTLSDNARRRVLQLFDSEVVARQNLDLYAHLIRGCDA